MRLLQRSVRGLAVARWLPGHVAFGLLKRMVPLPRLARWAWRSPAGATSDAELTEAVRSVVRLGGVIRRKGDDCLQRSLLLYRLLSRAGRDPVLVSGFRHEGGRVVGHSWVLVGGRPVADDPAEIARFVPALAFGARGALIEPDRLPGIGRVLPEPL